tara:strand:- start:176 stop:502 length:327 start_codon:yes stop_codon:yes gene_type:complete
MGYLRLIVALSRILLLLLQRPSTLLLTFGQPAPSPNPLLPVGEQVSPQRFDIRPRGLVYVHKHILMLRIRRVGLHQSLCLQCCQTENELRGGIRAVVVGVGGDELRGI